MTLYPEEKQPTMEDILAYTTQNKSLLETWLAYVQTAYRATPKFSFSACSGKPGWNVKIQKSGQSFGTLYPEENGFTIFIVISYKLSPAMEALLPQLTPEMAQRYNEAGDYMKLGKWMMFSITDAATLEDYKKICAMKLARKYKGDDDAI